jgi:hypothetical protein
VATEIDAIPAMVDVTSAFEAPDDIMVYVNVVGALSKCIPLPTLAGSWIQLWSIRLPVIAVSQQT